MHETIKFYDTVRFKLFDKFENDRVCCGTEFFIKREKHVFQMPLINIRVGVVLVYYQLFKIQIGKFSQNKHEEYDVHS